MSLFCAMLLRLLIPKEIKFLTKFQPLHIRRYHYFQLFDYKLVTALQWFRVLVILSRHRIWIQCHMMYGNVSLTPGLCAYVSSWFVINYQNNCYPARDILDWLHSANYSINGCVLHVGAGSCKLFNQVAWRNNMLYY